MKVSVVLSCGGMLHGDPCRQAIGTGELPADTGYRADLAPALAVAGRAGWRWATSSDGELLLRCPQCYRRQLEGIAAAPLRDEPPLPELTPDGVRAIFAPLLAAADRLRLGDPIPAAADCTLPCCRHREHLELRA